MKTLKRLTLSSFFLLTALSLGACTGTEGSSLNVSTIDAVPAPAPTEPGTPTDVTGLYLGPESVAKYVQKFVDDAKAQGVDVLSDMTNPTLSIRIASLDSYGSSVIGLCETGGGQRRVTLDPDFWDSVSETQRELLAHHELGHCVLYRGHKTSTLSSSAYASIMYPLIMSSSTYTNNYEYYQEELFSLSAQEPADPDLVVTHICDANEL
jgi:hypothetical protein